MRTLETSGRVMTAADLGLPLGYYGYVHSAWTPCWSAHHYGFQPWDECTCGKGFSDEARARWAADPFALVPHAHP